MPNNNATLDALVSVIKTLQERINRDHATGRNETRTRNVLIDPLLAGLGWSDPSVITSEYSIGYGRGVAHFKKADYALHPTGQKGRPIAFIEAKRMREDLSDEHLDQALTYAYRDSVKYVGLTNGDRWELYEIIEDGYRPILNVSIRDESAFDCAVKLLSFTQRIESREGVEDFGGMGAHDVTEETAQAFYQDLGVETSATPKSGKRKRTSKEAYGCLGVLAVWIAVIVWATVIQSGEPFVLGVFATVIFFVHLHKVETRRRKEAEEERRWAARGRAFRRGELGNL